MRLHRLNFLLISSTFSTYTECLISSHLRESLTVTCDYEPCMTNTFQHPNDLERLITCLLWDYHHLMSEMKEIEEKIKLNFLFSFFLLYSNCCFPHFQFFFFLSLFFIHFPLLHHSCPEHAHMRIEWDREKTHTHTSSDSTQKV